MRKLRFENFLIPFGVVLLFVAIVLGRTAPVDFYSLSTHKYSSHLLFRDTPDGITTFLSNFKNLFRIYARGYLLPVYLFLMPAILLLTLGIGHNKNFRFGFAEALENPAFEKGFLICLWVLSFAIVSIIGLFILHDFPSSNDEYSYIFQSDILARGKLFLKSPPLHRFFFFKGLINDGKWYSKYTIGWPALLALGKLLGIRSFLNPIMAAGSLVLLYLIGKKIHSRKAGLLSAFFALISPTFLLTGATYFPHTASGFFTLLFIYAILKLEERKKTYLFLLAGIFIIAVLLIRPSDGGIVMMGFIPLAVYVLFRSGGKKEAVKGILIIFSLFIAGIGLLMLVNNAQTGNSLLFGFLKYSSDEKWGMGTFGHHPLAGLWNLLFTIMRSGFWLTPFFKVYRFLCGSK